MSPTNVTFLKEELAKNQNVLVFVGAEINSTLNSLDPLLPEGRPSSRRFSHRASSSCHDTPTKAHIALVKLVGRGFVNCLVTENTDGLLMKAGATEEAVIEMNGNVHTEECLGCGLSFVREFCVQTAHCGVRTCQLCGGKLQDTVIRTESPDLVLKETISSAFREADHVMFFGSVPKSQRAVKYLHTYLNSCRRVTCISASAPDSTICQRAQGAGEICQWVEGCPAETAIKLCKSLGIEVLKYKIERIMSLIITRQENTWLIRTNCITSGGRHFSCLKGVDVIPCNCVDSEELDIDTEVRCYDPYQCLLPVSPETETCQLEIYYLFYGFNQEPEWSVGVPLCESSHIFNISCYPGDSDWKIHETELT